MTTSPKTDLACLAEGTRFLTRRPAATLGIATLGMLLFALAALLQIRSGLPDKPEVEQLLTFAGLLPLELYVIPRFLIATDARAGRNPLNAAGAWKQHFEERWLRAFCGKLVLALAAGLGLVCLVIPGILVLMAFGWVPLRILLRGESLVQAARGSLEMMGRTWRRVLLAVWAMGMVYMVSIFLLSNLVDHFVQDPTPLMRLTRPALWVENFLGCLLSLWLSACLLALFHRVEAVASKPEELPKAG